MTAHFVSKSCEGERCRCGAPATHKVGEEIPHDEPCVHDHDPLPRSECGYQRHNLTAYVCCYCFTRLLGPATGCDVNPGPLLGMALLDYHASKIDAAVAQIRVHYVEPLDRYGFAAHAIAGAIEELAARLRGKPWLQSESPADPVIG